MPKSTFYRWNRSQQWRYFGSPGSPAESIPACGNAFEASLKAIVSRQCLLTRINVLLWGVGYLGGGKNVPRSLRPAAFANEGPISVPIRQFT